MRIFCRKKIDAFILVHPGIQGGCGQVFNNIAREKALQVKDYPQGHDSLIERVCGLMGTIVYDNKPHFCYRQHQANTIGAKQSVVNRLSNMWKTTFAEYDPSTSIAPGCFLEAFGKQLDEEMVRFLKLCKDAHKNVLARLQLVMWRGMKKQSVDSDIIFKIKILIGKY